MSIKQKIAAYFLSSAFVLNIAAGMISNYSTKVFILKIICSLILFIFIYTDARINNFNFLKLSTKGSLKNFPVSLILFTVYLLFSLTYSQNFSYGTQKILNLITSTVPSTIAFYYLFLTTTEKRLKIFISVLVIITIATVTYVIIDYPFVQGTIYEFTPGKWSHVIYGRVMGCTAVVLLLFTLSRDRWKEISFYSVITSVAVYGLYLSALRSAFLGMLLVTGGLLLFIVLKSLITIKREEADASKHQTKTSNLNQLTAVLSVIAITTALIVLLPQPSVILTRFDNLTQVGDLEFGGDAPILSRIEALELAKEIFFDHHLFGVGLGGFRNYNGNHFTEVVKYPHNIFAEIAVEGGVVGLLILCTLLFFMFKSVSRLSAYLLIIAAYSLWLALFSKDIPSQVTLWIFIALISVQSSKSKVQSVGKRYDG